MRADGIEGSETARVSLCGLTPRPSVAPLLALSTISSSLSAHPSLPLLAEIELQWGKPGQGKLRLLRFDGSVAFEIPSPPLREGSPKSVTPGYTDCRFDDSGRLWCAARISADEIEVQLREADSWSIVSRTIVEDPLGEASAMFFPTPDQGIFSLSLSEGGGGSCVYWGARDGVRTRFSLEPGLCDPTPPVFAPSGREFLVIHFVGGEVQRYRYPVVQPAGVCESPFGVDDPFHVSLCYLNDTRALAGSLNGRIALLDTQTMRVVDEVTIEGHEPRPVEEYHPNLAGDRALCTDIATFERLGDYLIFFHDTRAPSDGSGHAEGTDDAETKGMVCFPIGYVLDRYAL
jgi:hypothetical protein